MAIELSELAKEARKVRGIELAKAVRIKRNQSGAWSVPSSKGPGSYTVTTNGAPTCSCPDFEIRGATCKHIFAVEFARRTETLPDGSVKTTVTKRVTYAQEWTSYNLAQTTEKARVTELLRELCNGVTQPPQAKGRPRLPLADMIFAATMKVFGGMSARRSNTDMEEYAAKGYLRKAPHFNSVLGYLEDPTLEPVLTAMIEESAAPLAAIEHNFAADSSGFSTCNYVRWFDEKYGRPRTLNLWIKAHIMVGVNTQIVTAVRVTEKTVNDTTELPPMLATTLQRFGVKEVLADKGYLSQDNAEAVVKAGATPYIPFKVNSTGGGHDGRTSDLWKGLFHFFSFKRAEFLSHYNQRSNVETAFSMIKRKFGAALRAKSDSGQRNELLCKILCHNLCCLVSAIYELGLEPTFWAGSPAAQQPVSP